MEYAPLEKASAGPAPGWGFFAFIKQKRRPLKTSAGGGLSSPGREIVKSRYQYVCTRHAKVQCATMAPRRGELGHSSDDHPTRSV